MSVCFFTAVCEEDEKYVNRYLEEVTRLDIPFAMHFDRCSVRFKSRFQGHPLLVARTSQDDPDIEFTEMHKQDILNKVIRAKFSWACALDIDETWEKNAKQKIDEVTQRDCDVIDIRWMNLWDSPEYVRVDPPFCGHRAKFLNLRNGDAVWSFYHPAVNGPRLKPGKKGPLSGNEGRIENQHDLVCLHWGLLTREDRQLHKERWDRIYTTAVGANPSGFWEVACDESITPVLMEHNYL